MQPQQPPASKPPLSAITTEQIQKCLEDNKNPIMAILECQKLGRFQECAQYQAVLQKNLMYLAAIADAQPPPTPQTPNPSQVMQMPPNSIPPQANSFMQLQQPGGQKLPFQVNSIYTQDQQQQLLLQQAGIRAGGLFGMQSPEVASYGGDGRGFFFDNANFRD